MQRSLAAACALVGVGATGLAVAAQAAEATPVPADLRGLNLSCDGSASWVEIVTDDQGTIGNFRDDTETEHTRNAGGRVLIRFASEVGSFRLPPTLPTTDGGGRWFNFSSIDVSEATITGRARAPGLLKRMGAVQIDRRSGEIILKFGAVTFSGLCQKAEEESGAKKF